MVAARERFLGAGWFESIASAVAEAAPRADVVVDIGAGTGYYLAALIDDALGVALESSRPALRRAARAHPRIAAVGCDVWRELPLQDGVADLVLNVFAPRNGPEITRVLAPGGTVVVVTPTPRHLEELAEFGTLAVEPEKEARLHAQLAPLRPVRRRRVEFAMELGVDEVRALIAMGPSAHHATREVTDGVAVTASVNVETFSRG